MRILVTAFEPFGGERENPTVKIIEQLHDVETAQLPVSFEKAPKLAIEKIKVLRPDAVIMLGQAGGRAAISLERCAINIVEAANPDNDGYLPKGVSVVEGGPDAYLSGLPLQVICSRIKSEGVPCHVSNSAGTYVCNALYYTVRHNFPNLPAIFIHVPYSPRQAVDKKPATPSMNISDMLTAVTTAITTIITSLDTNYTV